MGSSRSRPSKETPCAEMYTKAVSPGSHDAKKWCRTPSSGAPHRSIGLELAEWWAVTSYPDWSSASPIRTTSCIAQSSVGNFLASHGSRCR